ncbi:hypothetical protein [Pseudobdellovibrio exovorus]|uniref:Uncharacterized protein n=1 Tax=Pseudobdellovibrio exovorus JSS TaxID=1184267 RepID=M4VDD3_9BACT|nr:hypothetical protein [Pseudobdellovibrio exovorus]AGH96475.1 hypothetical protein A11Q_2259 [Pseudobdellovibrio exovorus JSS]
MKLNAAFIWVGAVFLSAIAIFVYLIKTDSPDLKSQVPMRAFTSEVELTDTLMGHIAGPLQTSTAYWIGIEPGKSEQIPVVTQVVAQIKKQHPVAHIIVDFELRLSKEELALLQPSDVISLKEHLYDIGEKLQKLEQEKVSYILVTAAIYSTSILEKNPIDIVKKQYGLNPLTLSLAYFPLSSESEKDMVFPCKTADDHTGTAQWGCSIVNKSRFVRKQFIEDKEKPWTAFIDSSGPSDFILVLTKI